MLDNIHATLKIHQSDASIYVDNVLLNKRNISVYETCFKDGEYPVLLENKNVIYEEDVIATFENNDTNYELKLDNVEEYWDYANSVDIERIKLQTNGKIIIANLISGIFSIWTLFSRKQ